MINITRKNLVGKYKLMTLPPPALTALCAAVLAGMLAVAGPALAQAEMECTIMPGNVWSPEGEYSIVSNTLTVEEGHFWSFPLTYKCSNVATGARPAISIIKPSNHIIDTKDFRGGYSESDGFGDGDEMTGRCLEAGEAGGCKIEFFASSKDNNCRNVGATLQTMTISTQITNLGPGDLNLTDQLDIMIKVTDDDTVSQKYLDMGYTQWKPTC